MYQNRLNRSGEMVPYYVYIPRSVQHSERAVLIVPDEGESADLFLEKSGWRAVADREAVVILLAQGGQEEDYYHAFFEERKNQQYFTVNKATCYLAGYGTGSRIIQKEILSRSQLWAGALCCGDFGVPETELKTVGEQESDVPFIKKSQVPVPVWLWTKQLTKEQNEVLDYWKHANQSADAEWVDEKTRHYHPAASALNPLINEQTGADLYLTEDCELQGCMPDATQEIWKRFLSRTVRTVAVYNGDLRPYHTMEDWHAEKHYMEHGNYRREWYEYIPSAARRDPDRKIPLVVCFHGGDNNGFTAMYRTNWIQVAESRNFAVVFPTGAMRRRADKNAVPHPAWNACGAQDIEDDVSFVRSLIEDVKKRYFIDSSRIYATGHSMSACMCQRVLLTMPEVFAAGAATGGVLKGGFFGYYDSPGVVEGYKMPLWIVLGENDRGGGDFSSNEKARANIEYWTERNETMPWNQGCDYTDGLYWNKVYLDESGVPLVRFTTVQYKPHTSTPQDFWFFYDEFFFEIQQE